jgi:serine phosphatase RsbU (regulator of sigma subunit)
LKPWDNARLLEIVKVHLAAPAPPAHTLDRDLAIARRVQERLFPASPRRTRHLRLAACCRPAGAVGGDYYDFLELAPGRTGLVLADLSGKGIGAALLMANLQATLRSLAWQAAQSLPLLLRTVNLLLRESTAPEHFATLMFGDWDDQRRVLRYANCGHPPALVLRAAGGVERLEPTAPVLGVIEAWTAAIEEAALAPGDRLVFSSDGVLECPAGDGAELGLEGLIAMLEPHRSTRLEELPRLLLEELAARAPHGFADDATLLCAEVE